MKQKQILEFVQSIVKGLTKKVESEEQMPTLPEENKEYTKGQLYEAQYILNNVEEIIFKD